MQYYEEPPPAYDAHSPPPYDGPPVILQDPSLTSRPIASRQNPAIIPDTPVTNNSPRSMGDRQVTGRGRGAPVEPGTLTVIQIRRCSAPEQRNSENSIMKFYLAVYLMIIAGILMISFNICAIIKEKETSQDADEISTRMDHGKDRYSYYNEGYDDLSDNSNEENPDTIVTSYFGHGIWGEICLVFTGALGIYAGIRKAKRPVITFVIISLVAVAILAGAITCSVFASNSATKKHSPYSNSLDAGTMNIVIAILASLGVIFAMCGSIRGCIDIYCYRNPEQSIRCDPIIIRQRSRTVSTRARRSQQQARRPRQAYSGHQFSQDNRPRAMYPQLPGTFQRPTNNQQQEQQVGSFQVTLNIQQQQQQHLRTFQRPTKNLQQQPHSEAIQGPTNNQQQHFDLQPTNENAGYDQ